MKKYIKSSLLVLAGLSLVACGGKGDSAKKESEKVDPLKFESVVKNEGEAIDGGTLRVALVGDPFEGILSSMFYSDSSDGDIISFFNEGLIGYDQNFSMDNNGFADMEYDKDAKTVTVTIPKDAKWDDGEPIDIDDVIFPYYVIGNKDYTGIRYGNDFQNIKGMEDYHNGKTDKIEGIERVDDYTVTFHYETFSNSMLQSGGGIGTYIEPEHIFKDIPIKDMIDSEYVRKNPVGFGPFKVEKIIPGESVTLVANEYYYKGRPKIDKVVLDVVSPDTVIAEMKAGKYDIAELPADQYETFKDAKNFTVTGNLMNALSYIGFRQGTWDADKGEVVVDESKVTSNKALRQAMGYAISMEDVANEFYKGLRIPANSMITPNFDESFYNKDLEGFKYDPEKAKQILADAGFKDTNGDGYVEDPKGKEFKLGFASMSGGETAEPLAQYFMQMWKEIGVHVELVDGRLMEKNSFYDRLEKDDPAIDVYLGAYGLGGDPSPNVLWTRDGGMNYARWASEENDKLVNDINSDKSFDKEFRKKAFYAWQEYFFEEAPAIPILYRYELTAINNRVTEYDTTIGAELDWSKIGLLQDSPIKE